GRPECGVLFSHAQCIRLLRTSAIYASLPVGRWLVSCRAHVQTDACNCTCDTSPIGLLAAAKNRIPRVKGLWSDTDKYWSTLSGISFDSREASFVRTLSSRGHRHICCAKARCRCHSPVAAFLAGGKRGRQLLDLCLANLVAHAPRSILPSPQCNTRVFEVNLATRMLVAITVTAIIYRNKWPYLFTGWLWYVLMLVPVIGLVQVGEQGHADRYTYLPHVGLFLLIVWGVADVIQARRSTWQAAAVTT